MIKKYIFITNIKDKYIQKNKLIVSDKTIYHYINNVDKEEECYLLIKKKEIIGYCKIKNVNRGKDEETHNIEIDNEDKIICDFYINPKKRKKGYGTILAKYILKLLDNKKIILHPDLDGIWFWKKFKFIEKCKGTYLLDNKKEQL